jgi:hypothetical protein
MRIILVFLTLASTMSVATANQLFKNPPVRSYRSTSIAPGDIVLIRQFLDFDRRRGPIRVTKEALWNLQRMSNRGRVAVLKDLVQSEWKIRKAPQKPPEGFQLFFAQWSLVLIGRIDWSNIQDANCPLIIHRLLERSVSPYRKEYGMQNLLNTDERIRVLSGILYMLNNEKFVNTFSGKFPPFVSEWTTLFQNFATGTPWMDAETDPELLRLAEKGLELLKKYDCEQALKEVDTRIYGSPSAR